MTQDKTNKDATNPVFFSTIFANAIDSESAESLIGCNRGCFALVRFWSTVQRGDRWFVAEKWSVLLIHLFHSSSWLSGPGPRIARAIKLQNIYATLRVNRLLEEYSKDYNGPWGIENQAIPGSPLVPG